MITIQCGNNVDLLKGYPDNHFDSIVTDAPYGFGKEPDALKLLQDWIDHGYHEITGSGFMGKEWDAFVPQPKFWKEAFRVLKPGGHLLCFFGTRTYDWGVMAIRLAGFEIRDMITWHYASGFPKSHDISKGIEKQAGAEREAVGQSNRHGGGKSFSSFGASLESNPNPDITKPATDEAEQWDGWGTALKPATEPICVARKPLEGTVVQNVLKYGTGGINLDGCRVGLEGAEIHTTQGKGGLDKFGFSGLNSEYTPPDSELMRYNDKGRFPSNVIFDPFTADLLDKQAPDVGAAAPVSSGKVKKTSGIYGDFNSNGDDGLSFYGDSGGASRFFYVAKPSQNERNAGCEHLEFKDPAAVTDFRPTLKTNPENWAETDTPFTRTGERKNNHPTVKPITLMRYLQRLVTPKGGLTLDPFAGSGTSGCSAAFEEINIVLMESEAEYIPIIEARTAYWTKVAERERKIQALKDSQTRLFD